VPSASALPACRLKPTAQTARELLPAENPACLGAVELPRLIARLCACSRGSGARRAHGHSACDKPRVAQCKSGREIMEFWIGHSATGTASAVIAELSLPT